MAVSRRISVVTICSISLVLYSMFASNLESSNAVGWIEKYLGAPADTARYTARFAASALLLGITPFCLLLIFRIPLRDIGLAAPLKLSAPAYFAGFIVLGILIGLLGSFDSSLRLFYPFHPRLAEIVHRRGGIVFVGHSVSYVFLYYLGWEIMFRGIFVVYITGGNRRSEPSDMGLPVVALLQAVPSAIIHIGHPQSEIFGALLFGFAAGYVTYATRSILPGLIVHALAGVSLDLALVLFYR